jgi:NAD(P)-dependent dehydrogenase (short-subunit alcohol dehydrogenase family)
MPGERAGRARVALVTGGNRGIGLEVCRQLAAAGVTVLLGSRKLQTGIVAATALSAERFDVRAVQLDITNSADIEAVRALVQREFGALDILVNNAAILLAEEQDIFEVSDEDFGATFDVNVFAQLAVCRAFIPAMVGRRYGRVVNVSSTAGQLQSMGNYAPAYSISKTALNALTKVVAESVSGTGVLVNSVNPGWVRTDMGGRHAPLSVEKGADTIVWAATLPDNGPTGAFLSNRRPIAW